MDGIKVQAINAGHRLPRRRRDDVIVVMEKFLWIPVDVRTVFFFLTYLRYVLPLCLEYTVHIGARTIRVECRRSRAREPSHYP